ASGAAERIDIREPGTDHELADLYAGASLLVLPSLVEGFGLTPLEAMACGCPVACSRAASLPEVAGDAAVYFDPLDVQAMAETMQLVLSDAALRRRMIASGHEQVRRYRWEDTGRRVYSIITDARARTC
ncbi:glycosyltransferase, partial [bacterium]|nr:glycosyltransferase [bacterium]